MPKITEDRPAELEAKIKEFADKVKAEVKADKGINKATGKGWRLIHDGKKVIAMIEGDPFSETTTRHQIFIGTEQKCRAEIKRLKLE